MIQLKYNVSKKLDRYNKYDITSPIHNIHWLFFSKKNHHDATVFNWTTFNCWFETSSGKLRK